MSWISVKERLPPFYKDVIGYQHKGLGHSEIEQCMVKNKGGIIKWCGIRTGHLFEPTHWQPLPSPPSIADDLPTDS